MAVSVSGNTNNIVYGKGDICLRLNPFDNFRMFTLYENWKNDARKPIDLSSGQKIYLVFKSNKKEIRIPEYDLINSNYNVDKVNGQVLFKISKKNAIDALAMDSDTFYITRVYDIMDSSGKKVISSEEEVLYTGKFKDETSNTVDSYTAQLKNMMNILEERNEQIKKLQDSNIELIKKNTDLSTQLTEIQDEMQKVDTQMDALEAKLAKYESGNEYTGEVIDDNAKHYTYMTKVNSEGKETAYTEEEMSAMTKLYEESLKK